MYKFLFLSLLVVSASAALIGEWESDETGAIVNIEAIEDPFQLLGTFSFPREAPGCVNGTYDMIGKIYPVDRASHEGIPIAFNVAFYNDRSNCSSVATWNGLFFDDPVNEIHTMWLSSDTADRNHHHYTSTRIGHDVFHPRFQ